MFHARDFVHQLRFLLQFSLVVGDLRNSHFSFSKKVYAKNENEKSHFVSRVDHEGKGGAAGPRGTSAKTDIAHVAISLERPESASPADGAHFIVRFTKRRGFHGSSSTPFIANLCGGEWDVSEVPDTTDGGGKPESSQKKRKSEAFRIFDEGGGVSEVMEKLAVPKSTAYDYSKEWKAKNFRVDARDDLPRTHTEFDAFAG